MAGSAAIIILVLAFGAFVFVLAMIQRKDSSRECPSCHKLVPQVDPVCRICGFDFRVAQNDQFGL